MASRRAAGLQRPTAAYATGARAIAAAWLFFVLILQCAGARAELVFRSVLQLDGQAHWSAVRKYADPADVAYPRRLADGTEVSVEEVQVFVQGNITPEDVYAAKVMESMVRRGRQIISGNSVSLAGSGGDVDAAMEIGRVLRKLRVATVVARGNQCLSSCVFAFMGGDRRSVAGRIGIHRPFFASNRDVPDRRAHYRQLQKRLQEYIAELDFPPSLYEAVMAVPPERISILAAAELKRFYLQGMSPAAEDEADATAARSLGISVLEYLQHKAQAQPCTGVTGRDGACAGETKHTAARGTAVLEPEGTPGYQSLLPAIGSVTGQIDAGSDSPGAASAASPHR